MCASQIGATDRGLKDKVSKTMILHKSAAIVITAHRSYEEDMVLHKKDQ